jgi:hypothetical protein
MSVSSPFAEKTGSMLGNFMIPAAAILGSLVAFGVFSNKHKHSHSHANAKSVNVKASPLAPKAMARPGPLISKVNSVTTPPEQKEVAKKPEPTLQPKSLPALVPAPIALETKPASHPEEMTAEQTFEQYRQAMLHTGPRDMEYQARAEMQSKGGMGNNAMWREQTASLRKSLTRDAATLLDEMNISINDRVVSDFNNVRNA